MKIGIDIHGVIDENPDFFSLLTRLFCDSHHEIHIITGVTLKPENKVGKKTLEYLEEKNISYTHLFSIIDYHDSIGTEIEYPDNSENPWMDGELWDKAKADYCAREKIDIMLDDTRRYGDYFTTPFVHFLSLSKGK